MDLGPVTVIGGVPIAAVVLVFGLLVGSFLNVVIARLPYEGQSIVTPRSRCPKCETPIAGWWNIPVLSWLLLRGKCATCKAPIDVRYPMVELLTGVLFVACFSRYGLSLAFLSALILTGSLVAITFIDIDLWEIPDQISIPGILIGVVLRPLAFDVPLWSGLLGAVAGGGVLLLIRFGYFVARGREGMGLGDPKLLAMIGAFLGAPALISVMLLSSVSGSIIGIILQLATKRRPDDEAVDDAVEELPTEEQPPEGFFARLPWALRMTFFPPEIEVEVKEGEEEGGQDDRWVPPQGALPFGPFLALGAIAQLLFGPTFQKLLFNVGLFTS